MIKLNDILLEAVDVKSFKTKLLVKIRNQMKDERVSGSAAVLFKLITKELIKTKS